jgi:hypothetical protein
MENPGKDKQDAANQCCLLASQHAEAARHTQKREEIGGNMAGCFATPGLGCLPGAAVGPGRRAAFSNRAGSPGASCRSWPGRPSRNLAKKLTSADKAGGNMENLDKMEYFSCTM